MLVDLPDDLITHCLEHASTAELVRATMVCRALRAMATGVAARRAEALFEPGMPALEEDEWVITAERPLPLLFQRELDELLSRSKV